MTDRDKHIDSIFNYLTGLEVYNRLYPNQYNSITNNLIICKILNLTYGYNLTAINLDTPAMSGIDFVDPVNSVAVRITATNSRRAIHETAQSFSDGKPGQRLSDNYQSLIIFIIATDFLNYKPPQSLPFTLQILNIPDFMRFIQNMNCERLGKIIKVLTDEGLPGELFISGTLRRDWYHVLYSEPLPDAQMLPTAPTQHITSTAELSTLSVDQKQVLRFVCLLPDVGLPWELFRQCLSEAQQQALFALVSSHYLAHRDDQLLFSPAIRLDYLNQLHPTRENCAEFLDRLLQYDRTHFWKRLYFLRRRDVLLQLAQTFGQAAKCLRDPDGILSLRCAAFYAEINEFSNELQWCLRAVQACEAAPVRNPWHLGNAYLHIADCYQRLADNENSLKFCKKILSLKEENFLPADPDIARIYYQAGLAQIGLNHHTAALQSLNQAWNHCMNATAEDHPLRISISNMLSSANKATGNVDEAREYKLQSVRADSRSRFPHTQSEELEQKLAQLEKTQGMPAIFRGSKDEALYFDIGLLYYVQGDYPKALEYHMQALKLREQRPGVTPKKLADSYHSIGMIFSDLSDQVEAMEYLQKAMELRESSANIPSADLIRSYLDLGAVYSDRGMHQYALEYFSKALSLQEKFLPPHSTELADTYTLMGNICRSLGQNREARDYYKMTVTVLEASQQAEQPAIAAAYMNLANAYIQLSQLQPALQYARRALHIYQKEFPKGHPLQITAQQTASWLGDLTK